MQKKKILSLLLSTALVTTMIPANKLLEDSSMSLGSLQNPKKNDENASDYVKGELTLSGNAEIPENQYVILQLGENTLGMDLNIAESAQLTNW